MVTTLPPKIGAYTIKSEMYDTGRTRVIHAHEDSFDGDVVIKFLPSDTFNDPDIRITFEREIQAIALLEHPAIVPIYDLGTWDGQPYIVMRYMAGGTLADRLVEGPLSLAETTYIIDRVAFALDAAHEKGIVHRDLKPSNILFDAGGQAYLSDFSMAGQNHARPAATVSYLSGSPAYMSPEQIYGASDLTWQSDIYSLGVLLYTMLIGQPPYEASSAIKTAVQNASAHPPDILAANVDLPPGFQAILEKAMAKEPQDRYEWASYLAFDVAALVEDPSATPAFDGGAAAAAQKEARSRQRRKLFRWALVTLGVMILAGAGIGIFLGLSNSLQNKRHPLGVVNSLTATRTSTPTFTPLPTQTFTLEAAIIAFIPTGTSTLTNTPTPSPTVTPKPSDTPRPPLTSTSGPTNTPLPPVLGGADKIAFLNENEIWMANLDGTDLEKLTDDKIPKQYLQWTPDGSALTYFALGCYWIVELGSEQTVKAGCFEDFEISPDMSQVVIGSTITLANKNRDWVNFIMPYDLTNLAKITKIPQQKTSAGCSFYGGRLTRFSSDGKQMAGIFGAEENGRQVDQIIVYSYNLETCGSSVKRIDGFPEKRFTMNGYSSLDADPTLYDFGWDGEYLFALHGNIQDKMGDLVIYNMNIARPDTLNPIGGKCCYEDIQFSPDGNYLLFVFKDINQEMPDRKIYYIPYYLIEPGASFEPVDLPFYFFRDNTPNIEPALRPATESRPYIQYLKTKYGQLYKL
jgi:serine/threonine protein kinase